MSAHPVWSEILHTLLLETQLVGPTNAAFCHFHEATYLGRIVRICWRAQRIVDGLCRKFAEAVRENPLVKMVSAHITILFCRAPCT